MTLPLPFKSPPSSLSISCPTTDAQSSKLLTASSIRTQMGHSVAWW